MSQREQPGSGPAACDSPEFSLYPCPVRQIAMSTPLTASTAASVVNISCYKFVTLENLEQLQQTIRTAAAEQNLKGTVLLSTEGINMFLAGDRPGIDGFVSWLQQNPNFTDIRPKESLSTYQPFTRLLVKIRREIISFDIQGIAPEQQTAPKLPAAELKRWLDEGQPFHLLDTRNDYEVDIGTFADAIRLDIDHFRQFPEAIAALPESMKEEPIVMFCTGGIRCEKAGPFMQQAGFQKVYQLDGGILKYFEEVGGDHWNGECFVFDQRVAVDPHLQETGTTQCYLCQAVVTPQMQQSEKYVPGKSCPACYLSPEEQMQALLQSRTQRLAELTTPLPGSVSGLNRRPLNVPRRCAGMTLLEFLSDVHPQITRNDWSERISESRIQPAPPSGRRRRPRQTQPLSLPLSPDMIVREGQRFDQLEENIVEPDVSANIRFLHEDDDLIVISKPAPLPMHACGRFNRNTLRSFLNSIYHPLRPHIVHRLDSCTSGVLLLCKRKRIAQHYARQFEQRLVKKTYLARIHGHPEQNAFHCDEPIQQDPGPGAIRVTAADGDAARTRFEVLSRLSDGTSIVRAFPETGRPNQIRIHLWSLKTPIVGDPAWLPDGLTGMNNTLSPLDPPLCLHAETLELAGPDGQLLRFSAAHPEWLPAEVDQVNL